MKNYCVNKNNYCVNKLNYCVNNLGYDNQAGEYTKHYYADALRIASKIGTGFSGNLCDSANPIVNYYGNNAGVYYNTMMRDLDTLIISGEGNELSNLEADYSFCNFVPSCGACQENELYYYHPDHLGSTGMVTDRLSNITAGYLYAPFGEILQEHLAVDNRIPKYAFNAKELDEENGMYYYSARYYAPPTFISRDPMFEKYPSISPYTYCANNPVKFVDPTGKFPFPMHATMVDKALSKTIISDDARSSVAYGASVVADITYGKVHSVHLDNMSSFPSIAKAYNSAKSNFRSNMNARNFQKAGVNLHTVADFYSHSNYIELYKDYAKENGKELDVNTIPTFSEAMQDPKLSQYLKDHNLKTGTSNNSGPLLISYVKSLFNNDKGSHNKMNLDDKNSYKGSQEFSGNITLHDAARVVAQKDIDQTVQQ